MIPCLGDETIVDGGIAGHSSCYGSPSLESDFFRNQMGCTNGIDLEGNLIKKVSLWTEQESYYRPERNETMVRYNFTILFEGRPLKPYEDALAVVDFPSFGCLYSDQLLTVDLVAKEGSKWALQEHVVDWKTIGENEPIPIADEYGTHSMHEMLTDVADGFILLGVDFGTKWASESALLRGEPGCYNGIDLEGSYVEEVTLTFRKIEANPHWCNKFSPRVVIWGNLGDAPATTPPCPTMESDHAATISDHSSRWLLLSTMVFCPFLLSWIV
jgi:hypothetical protein